MTRPTVSPLHPRVRVIHQDHALWVLDKPPGVLSHPNPPQEESPQSLVRAPYDFEREAYWIIGEDGKKRQLHLVHRLDQDTSGLILCAFNAHAAAALKEALYHHEFRKEYHALVLGIPRPPSGEWRDCLAKTQGKGQVKVRAEREGRPNAETGYQTLQVFPRAGASLLRLEPVTGRTHQLRVQTSSRGFPIAGDERYGDRSANLRLVELIGLRRMFLHAHRLELRHPSSGHLMSFTAEYTRPLSEPLARMLELTEPVRPAVRGRR